MDLKSNWQLATSFLLLASCQKPVASGQKLVAEMRHYPVDPKALAIALMVLSKMIFC